MFIERQINQLRVKNSHPFISARIKDAALLAVQNEKSTFSLFIILGIDLRFVLNIEKASFEKKSVG